MFRFGGSYPAAVIVLDNFIITQATRNIERVFFGKGNKSSFEVRKLFKDKKFYWRSECANCIGRRITVVNGLMGLFKAVCYHNRMELLTKNNLKFNLESLSLALVGFIFKLVLES